jgi:hydrogenase-4 component F
MIELLVLLTIGIPVLAAGAAWFAEDRRAAILGLVGFGVSAAGGLALAALVFAGGTVRAFGGLVVVDALGAWVLAIVVIVAAIAGAGSRAHLVHEQDAGTLRPRDAGRYYALLLLFAAGLAAVPLLDNLGLLWVSIEATTIVSALLVGFARTPASIEAAWKYLILGSIGIGFALLGTLLLYASSLGVLGETSDALDWTRIAGVAPSLDPSLVRLGFLFALAGYGTKAGLVPFHTWLPDAHSEAPSPVSALLSGAALAVALYALARFHLITTATLGPDFSSTLLVAFGLLSLAVALPFLVAQGDLKRLLAYSSIEHMGLAALALGFGGQLALLGFALHLVSHGLAKSTGFLAAGRLVAERGSRRIGRLAGSLARSPGSGRALLVSTLILGGVPPSGMFVAEIAILFGGVQTGWGIAAGAAAIILAVAVAAMLFHAMRTSVSGPSVARRASAQRDAPQPSGRRPSRIVGRAGLLAVPLGAAVVLGIWTPTPLSMALEQVAAVLGGRG